MTPVSCQVVSDLQCVFGTDPDYVIDQYLDICPVYTISSNYFKEKFGKMSPEDAKKLALKDFNRIVQKYASELKVRAKLGFSDDDPKFVTSAVDQFKELMKGNKNIEYTVFDTSGRGMKKINI